MKLLRTLFKMTSKNERKNITKEPIICGACKNMIEIGTQFVNHHISYFPENVIKVHYRCHGLIHKTDSDYPDLKPNPSQTIRWYRKKGVLPHRNYQNASYWGWLHWIDCVENGFMTEERIERISQERLQKYWEECFRIEELKRKLNVKEDWIASDLIQSGKLTFEPIQ